jgi:uncharacterized coiled-coil protein SlyX
MTQQTERDETIERFDCGNNGYQWCQGCYTMNKDVDGEYVKYDDHQAATEQQSARIAELESLISEQLNTIKALNMCIGGADSLTTDNLRLVDRLEAKLAIAVEALERERRLGLNNIAAEALAKIRGEQ